MDDPFGVIQPVDAAKNNLLTHLFLEDSRSLLHHLCESVSGN